MNGTWPIAVTAPSDSTTRRVRLPIALMAALALLSGLIAALNLTQLDFAVKLAVAAMFAIVATAVVTYRPIIFPLALYLFAVPFDGLLQTGSGTITKFLAAASMAIIVLVITDRRRIMSPPLVVGLWAAFLAWNVMSLMWSEDPWFRLEPMTITAQLFALFALYSVVRVRWTEVKVLLAAIVAGGVGCAGYGIYLFLNGSLATNTSSQRLNFSLSDSQGINGDHFSASLVFPIALATVAALHLRGWRKVLAVVCVLVLLVGVFASGTRGSVFAIGAIWLYLMIAYRHRFQLAVVALLGLAASAAVPNVWQRFSDPSQAEAGGRYSIWSIAFDGFRRHWLAGIGTGQFKLAYEESYLRAAHGLIIHPWMEDAHNIIASTSVELGIVGLALVLVAWYAQFRLGSNIPRTSRLFDARIAVQAGTLGLFVNAMTLDLLFYKYLWIVFMMGVLVRNAWLVEPDSSGEPMSASLIAPASILPRARLTVDATLNAK
jgi:hypothetical protein